VVGPCSIHDVDAALAYASKLAELREKLKNDVVIVMRVYFEKPRTVVGWKGLINDPFLDESFEINTGLRLGRKLLADITDMGLPVGCEYLDTILPQYTADLTAWAAIGARTVECQLHRELGAGLSMPVGFKNGTSGNTQIAVDACLSATQPHTFLSIGKQGSPSIVHVVGNTDVHVILRGGGDGPNYSSDHVKGVEASLKRVGISNRIIVDCSHGNSLKDPNKQSVALRDICKQLASGDRAIGGVMLESHLVHGSQSLPQTSELRELKHIRIGSDAQSCSNTPVLNQLKYGVSITDGCIGWEETSELLNELAAAVRCRRSSD